MIVKSDVRSDLAQLVDGSEDPLHAEAAGEVFVGPYDCNAPGLEARAIACLRTSDAPSTTGFLFSKDDLEAAPQIDLTTRAALHDDIARAQALALARYTTTLGGVLAIDDIYAHPLIRPADLLSGHRLRAFAAAPIRDAKSQLISVICAVDTTPRRWTARDIDVLRRIVAQFETLCLSHL